MEAEYLTTTEGGTVASICGSETEMYTCDHLQELNINVLHTVRGCQDPGGFIDHSSTNTFAFIDQQNLQTHNCFVRGWGAETTGLDCTHLPGAFTFGTLISSDNPNTRVKLILFKLRRQDLATCH